MDCTAGVLKTIPQGAATTVYAVVSPDLAGKSGALCCDAASMDTGGRSLRLTRMNARAL